ncbi:MAG: MFS transporter [bacterium]|nr:MFS transporter [bacterium]
MTSSRSQRWGWYTYDWANSAFYTTVVTVFLGPYLTTVAEASAASGADKLIHPFGLSLEPGSWFPFMVSASVVLQVLVLPVIGAFVDGSPKKRSLLGLFAFTGALFTTALFFLQVSAGNYMLGGLLFIIANLAFGASIVVYNSFLPQIAAPEERDKVSSRGWALGYLGGGLLLLTHLLYYNNAVSNGLDTEMAVRIILASAGIWWALFTIVPLLTLPKGRVGAVPQQKTNAFRQLFETLKDMRRLPQTLTFLIAYLLYNDAVQTVIVTASQFGQEELNMPLGELMQTILMVQFVAIAGSLLFERVAAALDAKRAIVIALIGWIGVIIAAYAFVQTATHFFILAAIIAIVLGGVQALSRSLYSQLIPAGKEAEYFSLYEIGDKASTIFGPLLFGIALSTLHSYRSAVLSLLVMLVAGLLLLLKVNVARGIKETAAQGGR